MGVILSASATTVFAENPNKEPKGEKEFAGRKWISYANSAEVGEYKGKPALHVVQNGGGMVLLKEVQFDDGTIECDIAKGPFTGIVFRSPDSQHGDCVFFRPQNAVPGAKALDGTLGRDKVVQYVAWGDPKTEWSSLRKNFPGKYEAYAPLPLDNWFHVRLEIKGRTVKVLVNDAQQPCLVVENTLSGQARGNIGLWAWDGYFANFEFTPADTSVQPGVSSQSRGQPAAVGTTAVGFEDPRKGARCQAP